MRTKRVPTVWIRRKLMLDEPMSASPDWLPEWLKAILAEPTASVPDAGRAVGIKGRNQAYEAARRGDIPTIEFNG